MNNRDKKGKYSYSDMNMLCVCGHALGSHTGEYPHDCCYGDDPENMVQQTTCVCDSIGFKPANISKNTSNPPVK
jgi:hypothetical protein